MRIDLIYWKACKCMDGVIPVPNSVTDENPNGGWVICPTCKGKGYTEETMEFEYEDSKSISVTYKQIDGENRLILHTFNQFRWDLLKDIYGESIPNFNPQSIHFIEEKECPIPICKDGICITGELDRPYEEDCTHCKGTGKIEKETSFIVFDKSQEEYDAEIRRELAKKILNIEEESKGGHPYIHSKILEILEVELNSEQETNGHT